jgi:mono/diheme cytochrome c family protein
VTGQLWGLWLNGSHVVEKRFLADTRKQIVSFGQAAGGEVVFLDWPDQQHLHRLIPNPAADQSGSFPRMLSDTGIFSDLVSQAPQAGVYEFKCNGSMWHDGATAARWVAIPDHGTLVANKTPFAEVPANMVLAKTLSREGRRLETQVLHYDGSAWQGYSYRWNESQSDATLVAAAGETVVIDGHPWTFHSRAECVRCHNIGSDYRLAFHPGQLKREGQLDRFLELGLVNETFVEKASAQPAADLDDANASLEDKARTWLSANCAHCHRSRGGGSVTMEMSLATPLESMKILDVTPEKGGFGITDPALLVAGDPYRSVLYYRAATAGIGHMPMIGARTVDAHGVALVHDWIASLGQKPTIRPGLETVEAALHLANLIRSKEITGQEAFEWIQKAKASENAIIAGLFSDLL